MSYCSGLREHSRRRTWRNTMPRWQKLAMVRVLLQLWLIAGTAFQESHAGTVLKNGLGDHGNAFGVMQVWSTFLKTQISSFLWSRVQRMAEALLKGNPLNLFSHLFGQAKANANQAKANADQAVSSQHQGSEWVSICSLHEQTTFTLWNWWLLPSTPLGLKRLIVPISHLDNRSCFKKQLLKLSTL